VNQILLLAQVSFCRLDRCVAKQQLDLLQLASCRPAQFRGRAPKVMRRDTGNTGSRSVRSQQLPDDLLGQAVAM
jgi:hypothetical protein